MIRSIFAALLALSLSACATTGAMAEKVADHPEARPYAASADASAEVDAALATALRRGTLVMIVLGANWCHDSRAFAGWMETERFKTLIGDWYEVVYVDAGEPQKDKGRNMDIAARFGVTDIEGTPTVLILNNEGTLLNGETAKSWRNAASRSEDAIYEELAAVPMGDMGF